MNSDEAIAVIGGLSLVMAFAPGVDNIVDTHPDEESARRKFLLTMGGTNIVLVLVALLLGHAYPRRPVGGVVLVGAIVIDLYYYKLFKTQPA